MGKKRAKKRKSALIGAKASDAFQEWYAGLLEFTRLPSSTLVELALIEYAKKVGYDPPAPKR